MTSALVSRAAIESVALTAYWQYNLRILRPLPKLQVFRARRTVIEKQLSSH